MCGMALPCRRRLIIVSLYEPILTLQFAVDAIQSLLAGTLERDVPFVARPAIVAPPVPGSSPWSSNAHHFPVNTALLSPRAHLCGPTLISLHHRAQWRTKDAKTKTCLFRNW